MESDNTIKILWVDDEVKFLKAVSKRLSIKGFDVTTATNGDKVIDLDGYKQSWLHNGEISNVR